MTEEVFPKKDSSFKYRPRYQHLCCGFSHQQPMAILKYRIKYQHNKRLFHWSKHLPTIVISDYLILFIGGQTRRLLSSESLLSSLCLKHCSWCSRLNDNVKDNDILRLSPLQPFSDVYWSLAEDDNSNVLKDILQEGIDTSQAFYILFMASYYGYTGVCERILSSHRRCHCCRYIIIVQLLLIYCLYIDTRQHTFSHYTLFLPVQTWQVVL